jgi:sulfide:quinone oxidoreductase
MTKPPLHVLIAGGGVAGVETALALRKLAGDRVHIELMSPAADLVQRPESVRTPFSGISAPRLPLERLAALGVDLRQDSLAAVDPGQRQVRTTDGAVLPYDRLVVATGGRPVDSIPGATHFRGPLTAGRIEGIITGGEQLTFAVPEAASWPLPLYELALQAAAGAPVRLVTAEPRPLDLFGAHVSDAVARLLDRARVDVLTGVCAHTVIEHELVLNGHTFLATGPVVTLPALDGPRLTGLPYDLRGFVPVDPYGRVHGVVDVFAAGDVSAAPIKQGGLAAQQADAVAAAIAVEAGAAVESAPATRVLRAELVTADRPLFLRGWPGTGSPGQVSAEPLWEPRGKLAGRYLAGFLAEGTPDHELVDLRLPAPAAAA